MDGRVIVVKSRHQWDSKLAEAQANGKIVVVDFTASWCGPCKIMSPFFAELSEKYPQLIYLKVDVDELADVSEEWDVSAMPTFIFIKDGKLIDKLVGAIKLELQNKVDLFATRAQQ
eukprot:c20768_g1_i1 orf=287-634(+)